MAKPAEHAIELIPGVSVETIAIALIVTIFGGVAALWFYANYIYDERAAANKNRPIRDPNLPPPSEIVSLRIYPIKSCRGIEIQSCRLRKTGLDLDRNWMFVDAKTRQFLTIRSDPSMTLIDTAISIDTKPETDNDNKTDPSKVKKTELAKDNKPNSQTTELHISIHGTEDRVTVPCYPTKAWLSENTTLSKVEIWGEETDAWQYPESINSIFSAYFKKPVALVYKGPSPRLSRGNASPELYSGKEQPHHFADVMSLQIASESSLQDLNTRLEKAGQETLTIERFRPNIIIRGNVPWEEDSWKRVRIDTTDHVREALYRVPLDVLAHCARCQVPNVNPDTAEKHAHEPWDTLMKFRRIDQGGVAKYKPCFGMLCIPNLEGPITVGSSLEVLEVTDKHLYNTAKFEEL